ncbi:MAG: hypothetical protein KC461_03725 [Dehalococcoidia bacterium]|nr:hypothetical protein [Dehalococcoidia bacterium]MCA9849736.1 hypothetical protein [Dehalococcoidia bacterium]MCA9855714.1 hypothetical protein [Dehalococcoidia bacterium]
MPGQHHSPDRLQFVVIAGAMFAMLGLIFVGHVISSPPEHLLGPDLMYVAVIAVLCLGAVGIWALTRRPR